MIESMPIMFRKARFILFIKQFTNVLNNAIGNGIFLVKLTTTGIILYWLYKFTVHTINIFSKPRIIKIQALRI